MSRPYEDMDFDDFDDLDGENDESIFDDTDDDSSHGQIESIDTDEIQYHDDTVFGKLGQATEPVPENLELIRFLELFNRYAPLLAGLSFPAAGGFSGVIADISKRIGEHQSLFDETMIMASLNPSEIGGEVAHELASSLSHLMSRAGFDSERLRDVPRQFQSVLQALQAVNHDWIREMEVAPTHDLLLRVKLAIFPPMARFSAEIAPYLGADHESELAWFYDTIVELARDLAFNWSKRASIEDRENLFISSLTAIGHILADCTADAWSASVLQAGKVGMVAVAPATIMTHVPAFWAHLEIYNMGWADSDRGLSGLRADLSGWIQAELARIPLPLWLSEAARQALYSSVLKDADLVMQKAWSEVCDGFLSRIESMSDEEREQFLLVQGQDGMPVDEFVRVMTPVLGDIIASKRRNRVDVNVVTQVARDRVALLWGLSDSLCKVRHA